jgi:enoyl-CoA hydratase
VGWLRLARPATRNRLDLDLVQALADACAAMALDPDVRVVVLAGDGRDFSVGLPSAHAWLDPAWPDPVAAVAALPQPVIAAIDGEARGWGLGLALACDLRILGTRAVLSAPDAGAGRLPGGGVTQRLPRIVGVGRATAMLLLGMRVSARDALAWGLAVEVVPAGGLGRTVEARARELARRGPIALQYAKEAVRRALDLPLGAGVRWTRSLRAIADDHGSPEGVAAFATTTAPIRGR